MPDKNDPVARKKILETALAEFMELGLEGARMQSIADRAECNKAMLHYYFANKENLYQESINFLLNSFESVLQKSTQDVPSLQVFLDQVTTTFFNYHRNNPGFIRLLTREITRDMKTLQKVFEENRGRLLPKAIEKLLFTIKKLQETGEIRNDLKPLHIMMTVMGVLGSSMLQARVFAKMTGEDFDSFLEQRREALILILNQGLQPQSSNLGAKL